MSPQLLHAALADAVLALHVAVVLYVVGGLPAIVVGNRMGWRFVNARWFRWSHLGAVAVVIGQAWLGQYCLLTVAETWLRERAGQGGYPSGFIPYWVHRLLFYEAPLWQFAVAYTVFGVLVVWAWWRYPPQTGRAPVAAGDAQADTRVQNTRDGA